MLLNTNSWRNTPQTLSIRRMYCGWHGILSVLPVHEKSALVSYLSLTLDHIGPACTAENEADVMEPGNKSSRQRLSAGGCTRLELGWSRAPAQSSPGSCAGCSGHICERAVRGEARERLAAQRAFNMLSFPCQVPGMPVLS